MYCKLNSFQNSSTSGIDDVSVGDLITFEFNDVCDITNCGTIKVNMIPALHKYAEKRIGSKSWLLELHLLANTNRYTRQIVASDVFIVIDVYKSSSVLPYWLPRSVLLCLYNGNLYNIVEDHTVKIKFLN